MTEMLTTIHPVLRYCVPIQGRIQEIWIRGVEYVEEAIYFRPPARRTAFFFAVEELDKTLAAVLDSPRLDTKKKKLAPPGSLSASSDSPRKNRSKIINYRQKLSMFGRIAVSPPEK